MTMKSKDIAYRDACRKLLGEQILAIMDRKGVTVAELAERLELTEKRIDRILEGKFSISVDFLYHVLYALDVHVEFVDNE